METFSALLAICAGISPVPGEIPAQRPVTRSFDVFLDLRLNKRLSKHSWGWWFETLSRPLWRHRNVMHFSSYLPCSNIEGILPKGPYLPCVNMAGRALLAGHHRYRHDNESKGKQTKERSTLSSWYFGNHNEIMITKLLQDFLPIVRWMHWSPMDSHHIGPLLPRFYVSVL